MNPSALFKAHASFTCLASVLLLGAIAQIGCDQSTPDSTPDEPDEISAVEWFETNQANTMTPHGRIVPGSAVESEPGYIEYETDSGTKIKVRYTKLQDRYRYDDPQQLNH